MYHVSPSKQYLKSLKKVLASGKIDLQEIDSMIDLLASTDVLPSAYQDHALKGDWAGYRECHIRGDLLLVYKKEQRMCILILIDIGSHGYLF